MNNTASSFKKSASLRSEFLFFFLFYIILSLSLAMFLSFWVSVVLTALHMYVMVEHSDGLVVVVFFFFFCVKTRPVVKTMMSLFICLPACVWRNGMKCSDVTAILMSMSDLCVHSCVRDGV